MSTENTQTAEAPSTAGASAESTGSTQLGEANQSSVATGGIDGLKKLAKESAESDFQPKPVEEAMKDAAPVVPALPQYTPNFKYKAALQDKEVDPFWRPLIKDADSEKKVIEALQRLDGFDSVKASREKLNQEYQSLYQDFTEQSKIVHRVETALSQGDLSSAFRQLGVTPEQVFRWTQDQLQRMELPPEQRRAFEEAERLKAQQYDVQEQMTQYQEMYEKQSVQARTVELDLQMGRQDVAQAAEKWDQLMGQQGAFRNLVIQEAQNAWYNFQQDLSAEHAVQLVLQKFNKVLAGQAMAQSQATPQVGGQAPVQNAPQMPMPQASAPQAKPVIPNVNGKGTAPIKKVPKSIDDLKRFAKEASAEG